MKKNFLAVVVAAVLLTGCAKKIEIEGEVFVEDGGSVRKLANVELSLIPEEQFAALIKSKAQSIESEAARINSEIQAEQKSIETLEASSRAILDAQLKVAMAGSWNTNTLGGQYMQQQQDALNSRANESMRNTQGTVSKSRSKIKLLEQSIRDLNTGKNGRYFFPEKISGTLATVSTNSDGKYKLQVKSDRRAALLAAKDGYYWFLWVSPDGIKTLNLTNTNTVKQNCDICIFDGKTTPQSF